jgi:hypothetical protein
VVITVIFKPALKPENPEKTGFRPKLRTTDKQFWQNKKTRWTKIFDPVLDPKAKDVNNLHDVAKLTVIDLCR